MSSSGANPDRPALSQPRLAADLVEPGSFWREIRVVDATPSTNTDVLTAARSGTPEGLVIVAELQTAGRGRLGRGWVSPPRAGLTFSALLQPAPAVHVSRWGWLPLLVGVALQRAVTATTGVRTRLKWPNDLLAGAELYKAAGLLVQAEGGAVAAGIGLNVTNEPDELPRADATSLMLTGATSTDRSRLVVAILRELAADYLQWRSSGGAVAPLHAAYIAVCDTLGREVTASLPDGRSLTGVAVGVHSTGALVLRSGGRDHVISAGDVVHLR